MKHWELVTGFDAVHGATEAVLAGLVDEGKIGLDTNERHVTATTIAEGWRRRVCSPPPPGAADQIRKIAKEIDGGGEWINNSLAYVDPVYLNRWAEALYAIASQIDGERS